MNSALSQTHRRDYSDLASEYDRSRFESPSGRFLARTDTAIVQSLVEKTNCREILDVPTGTGRVFEYLPDFPGTIVGSDLTWNMCQIAKTRISNASRTVILADASQLPFSSGQFDCLISLRFFHLFPPRDRGAFAAEFARIIRPGGSIICSFTNGWYGGGYNWLRRGLGLRTVEFLHRGEMSALFPNWSIKAVRGNFLPCQWRLALLGKWSENSLQWMAFHTPLKSLCWEKFFLLQKPGPREGQDS